MGKHIRKTNNENHSTGVWILDLMVLNLAKENVVSFDHAQEFQNTHNDPSGHAPFSTVGFAWTGRP
jgi:hypothetical protein